MIFPLVDHIYEVVRVALVLCCSLGYLFWVSEIVDAVTVCPILYCAYLV